jgi:hypothetical protein
MPPVLAAKPARLPAFAGHRPVRRVEALRGVVLPNRHALARGPSHRVKTRMLTHGGSVGPLAEISGRLWTECGVLHVTLSQVYATNADYRWARTRQPDDFVEPAGSPDRKPRIQIPSVAVS